MAIKIMMCDCRSEYQDEVYGKGKRVFNECRKHDKKEYIKYRCTVCGKIRE
uniref:TFIIS-type domain-containing protein n=1 Tax=viral metagenome TaxID=1070528 RepID=A0A6M3LIF9_9ZZZZ